MFYDEPIMPWTTLCAMDELTEGHARAVEIDGYHLAVFLHDGEPFVLDDTCPHAGASMSGGWVEQGCAVCPRHAWRFDLETGNLAGGGEALRRYSTRLHQHDGTMLVQADLAMP